MKNIFKKFRFFKEKRGFRVFYGDSRDSSILKVAIRPGFTLKYDVHHEAMLVLHLFFIAFYIAMPNFISEEKIDGMHEYLYGTAYHNKALWFYWGTKMYRIRMPWDWEHVRAEVMDQAGNLQPRKKWSGDKDDLRHIKEFDYTYKLKNGEIQKRKAKVHIEEREWRWYWFQWLPYPRKISRSISVDFNDEVGEGTGSWKGGVMGCGLEMKPGETMAITLRRMEKIQKFGR
jgi:hypothetical protein